MEIADLQPDRFSYEVRYANAYLMWDRAGAIMQALLKEVPNLEMVEANPARITLSAKPNVDIVIELGKAFAVVHRPKRTGDDLITYATVITKAVLDVFEIASFSRVGTRLVYVREFPTLEQAAARLMSFKMLDVPKERIFNQKGALQQADYRYRWEGEATGVLVRFATETQKIEFNAGPQISDKVQSVSQSNHRLMVDIDYFSTTAVLKEQLKIDDWIRNTVHMANRDTKLFMRER